MSNIKLFESKQVRSVWNETKQKWYFSVQDVVEILTDSSDVKQYIKKMLSRDEQLKATGVQFVPQLKWKPPMAKWERFRLPIQKVCSFPSLPSLPYFRGDVSDSHVCWLRVTRRHQGTVVEFVSALRITASRLRQTSPENLLNYISFRPGSGLCRPRELEFIFCVFHHGRSYTTWAGSNNIIKPLSGVGLWSVSRRY